MLLLNIFLTHNLANNGNLTPTIIIQDSTDIVTIHKVILDAETVTIKLTCSKETLRTIHGTQEATTMQETEM